MICLCIAMIYMLINQTEMSSIFAKNKIEKMKENSYQKYEDINYLCSLY